MTQAQRIEKVLNLLREAEAEAAKVGWAEMPGDHWNIGGYLAHAVQKAKKTVAHAQDEYRRLSYGELAR